MTDLAGVLSHNALEIVFGFFLLILLAWALLAGFLRWIFLHGPAARQRAAVIVTWTLGRAPMRALLRRFPRLQALEQPGAASFEYLGVQALLGLALALALVGFLVLSRKVMTGSPLTLFDQQLAEALSQVPGPNTRAAMEVMTMIGSGWVLGLIALVTTVFLLRRRQKVLATGLVVAMIGGGILNQALKAVYRRPRPFHHHSWSFPSGHAMESLIAAGMLWYLAETLLPRRAARLIGAGLLLMVLFIGTSRLVLGWHYFSDVIAGYAAGLVWVTACISATEIARRGDGARADGAPGPEQPPIG